MLLLNVKKKKLGRWDRKENEYTCVHICGVIRQCDMTCIKLAA